MNQQENRFYREKSVKPQGLTPTDIETMAEKVAVDCIIAFRKASAATPITDRDMRQIIQLRVENALSKAVLGMGIDGAR